MSLRFSQCELCFQFKKALANPRATVEFKLGQMVHYRAHLHGQFSDRSVLWQLGELAALDECNIIVASMDGMDQAKFRLPRDPSLRSSATLSLGLSRLHVAMTQSTRHFTTKSLHCKVFFGASQAHRARVLGNRPRDRREKGHDRASERDREREREVTTDPAEPL